MILPDSQSLNAVSMPLLSTDSSALNAPLVWRHGQWLSRAQLLCDVASIRSALPATRYVLNLCEDRYLFLTAFAAAGANGQINLLPSSRAVEHLQRLLMDYPDSAPIRDQDIERGLASGSHQGTGPNIPQLAATQVIALAFTSGSTGLAQPHPKTWGELCSGARQARDRFGLTPAMTVVATVPPQHMYGLETSIMNVLASGVRVDGGRPFFPADVCAALAAVPAPRILVTTPVHLRACIQAPLAWPALTFVISATAPLAASVAAQAEAVLQTPVLEIYGCTEAGSIASRRTLDGEDWHLYDGFHWDAQGGLVGAHLPQPVPLPDVIEPRSHGYFRLLGRQADLVNIAGKRASLAALNQHLNQIEGVIEGVFLPPETDGSEENDQRLRAVVVAPTLSERQVLAALAQCIDPVFLPRPLLKVGSLPRNETGKITQESLRALLSNRPIPVTSGQS